mgnify:CR=1 FL=1
MIPNNKDIEKGYINGLTRKVSLTNNINDEAEWMKHTVVAKVCSNIDDTKLKVVFHDLNRSTNEITAFEYPDVGKMYSEISPALTATVLLDESDNIHLNSGK